MKLLLTTTLFIVYANLPGQLNNHSYANFTFVDVLNYTLHSKQNMANSLQQAIDEGKIKIYSDSSLKKSIAYNDYYHLIEVKKHVLAPNPSNPDDIYDLIDTFTYSWEHPNNFMLLENGAVECSNSAGFKLFVSYTAFKKMLDERLKSMFEYFKQYHLKIITDSSLISFCKTQVKQQGLELYKIGINRELPVYSNDLFQDIRTVEDIKTWTQICITKQFQNPNNPNDKYDLIDSTFCRDFDPETINVLRAYFQWKNNGVKTEAEFVGFAPLYRPMIAGLLLSPTPLFVIKSTDYFKHINKTEKQFWLHFYSYLLQNRAFYEDFNIYKESDFGE